MEIVLDGDPCTFSIEGRTVNLPRRIVNRNDHVRAIISRPWFSETYVVRLPMDNHRFLDRNEALRFVESVNDAVQFAHRTAHLRRFKSWAIDLRNLYGNVALDEVLKRLDAEMRPDPNSR